MPSPPRLPCNRSVTFRGFPPMGIWFAHRSRRRGSIVGTRLDTDVPQDAGQLLGIREAQLRAAMALANIGSWEWDVEANSVIWSPELRRILGVADDFPARVETFLDMIHPEDRAWAERSMAESLQTGVAAETPFRVIRPDGIVRVLKGPAMTCRFENDKPIYMVGVLQDLGDADTSPEFTRDHALFESMSERERQVLLLVVRGGTSKGIAAVLGLSPKTVETYRSRIMAKLEVNDLGGLIRFSIRHRLTAL
jgi:PAS domain S-box-containing protein